MVTELEANSFFKLFGEKSVRRLAEAAQVDKHSKGGVLFSEGDRADCIYLLIQGEVELVKSAGADRGAVVGTVKAGDYFGELAVLTSEGRRTTAKTLGAATVAKIPASAVHAALTEEPASATIKLMKRVIDYLGETTQRYTSEVLNKEKTQLVGEMANSIIHDFKNPIMMIQWAVDAVGFAHQDAPTKKACDTIMEQSERMLGMAKDLLDFAQGKSVLEMRRIKASEIFERVARLNESYLQGARVGLKIAGGETDICVDPDRFPRVLQNLLGNAVDVLTPGQGVISMAARSVPGGVEISVGDNGPGIPEAIRERLFQPFTTYGKKRGTGLGLAICKTLVEAHRGTISVTSKPGEGTTFLIQLPPPETQRA